MQFMGEIESYLLNNPCDLMIGSINPMNVAKLLNKLHLKHKIPYILDFRDFKNYWFLKKEPNLAFNEKIQRFFLMRYLKKWTKKIIVFDISFRAYYRIIKNIF